MAVTFGRYQLLRKIASGGMGQVFLARAAGAQGFEKLLVIKRILPHLTEDEGFLRMFLDEARIAARLNHPNLVQIFELGEAEGAPYLAMEYVEGESLRQVDHLARTRLTPLPIGACLRIIADAAAGLDYAHHVRAPEGKPLELVHRDVSPQNILVGFDGAVKLIDFGVAKAAGRLQNTVSGMLKGKYPYMSPEQARSEAVGSRSDIFSLGIVLWELLTGKRLFKGENELATVRLVADCLVPPPSKVNPALPPELDGLIGRVTLLINGGYNGIDDRLAAYDRAMKALAPPEQTQQSDARGFLEALYEGTLAAGTFTARAYYDASRYNGSWVYPSTEGGTRLAVDSGQADWLGAEGQVRLPLFARNHLSAGLEAQHQLRVDQAAFGFSSEGVVPLETRRRSLFSAYLNDEWALHPRASLSAGLRVDKYLDLENVPVTPRVAVTARPYDGGLTKLVAGSAFRAPNVYELYYEDDGSTQKPALRLDPETIATFELEHSHDLTPELRLMVAGYHNRITRLIALAGEQTATPECGEPRGTLQCVVFQNTPTLVRAFGAEAELRWQPGRFALVDLSYSFVSLLSPLPELRAGVPSHLLAARLLLPLGASGLHLAAQATYQSPRSSEDGEPEVGEALLVNFGLSGELSRLRFFAGVNNLLDTRYQLPASSDSPGLNVPQHGRTFLLQLTASY